MRPSVQMYTLTSEKNEPFTLRELKLEMPLKCKKAEGELTALNAQAILDFQTHKTHAIVQLNPDTLALTLKGKHTSYPLKTDRESLRLKRHMLQCWVMLLRSRQTQLNVDHQKEIDAAQRELKYDGETPT